MVIFNSYVKLPEGTRQEVEAKRKMREIGKVRR